MITDEEEERRLHEERSAAGRQAKADKDVVTALLSTTNGRYWVERLLDFCAMHDTVHTSIDDTLIKLGRRQVSAYILDQIDQHCPDAHVRLILERRARVETEQIRKAEADKVQKRSGRLPSVDDMPGTTQFEELMDQQARDLAPKEPPK